MAQGHDANIPYLKPAIGMLPNGIDSTHSVENEWLSLRLASFFGLDVAEAKMENLMGCDASWCSVLIADGAKTQDKFYEFPKKICVRLWE